MRALLSLLQHLFMRLFPRDLILSFVSDFISYRLLWWLPWTPLIRGFLGRGCKPQDTFCSNERYSDQNSYCTSLDDTKAFLTDSPNQDLQNLFEVYVLDQRAIPNDLVHMELDMFTRLMMNWWFPEEFVLVNGIAVINRNESVCEMLLFIHLMLHRRTLTAAWHSLSVLWFCCWHALKTWYLHVLRKDERCRTWSAGEGWILWRNMICGFIACHQRRTAPSRWS